MPQNLGPTPSNGQFYPAAINGNLFSGGNQAAVATAFSAGLPTTYTGGLVLANPIAASQPATPVNLVILRASAAFVVAQTNAAAIGIGVGVSTSALSGTLTAVPVQAANPSNSAGTGLLYSSASITLPSAPLLRWILGTVATGAETTEVDSTPLNADIQGAIIIPPGGYAVFTSSAAGTASSFLGSFTWLELPAAAGAG